MANLNTFEQYLISKNIEVVEDLDVEIGKKDIDGPILLEQLRLISEFHKNVMGSTGIIKDRLDSCIGRVFEDYKVNIKKLTRDIDRIEKYGPNNTFEKTLLKKGNEYVEIGEKVIKNIYDNGYYDLIKRSMKNKEICLSDVNFSNIMRGDKIQVKNIKKCCYDMVEMDCYNLLYKCKKAGLKLDYKELVSMFCNFEGLDNNSYQYIISLLSFPYEFAKQCNKYRLRKKDLTDEQYTLKLYKAIIQDDLYLI